MVKMTSQVVLVVKNPPAYAGDKRREFDTRVRKIPWRRKWQPTPVLLPGGSHGLRSVAGSVGVQRVRHKIAQHSTMVKVY